MIGSTPCSAGGVATFLFLLQPLSGPCSRKPQLSARSKSAVEYSGSNCDKSGTGTKGTLDVPLAAPSLLFSHIGSSSRSSVLSLMPPGSAQLPPLKVPEEPLNFEVSAACFFFLLLEVNSSSSFGWNHVIAKLGKLGLSQCTGSLSFHATSPGPSSA